MESLASPYRLPQFSVTRQIQAGILAGFFYGSWISCAMAITDPPITINGPSFQVPLGDSRRVYRVSRDGPAPAREFLSAHGEDWLVAWDPKLETGRLLVSLKPVLVVPPELLGSEPDKNAIANGILSFVDENADFFGATSASLGEAHIYSVAGSWVCLLHQVTQTGIPLRGANLRAVIHPDGTLAWVVAFLVRSWTEPSGTLLDRAQVEAPILASGGAVHSAKLQMGFPDDNPKKTIPIWVLEVIDPIDGYFQCIVDAISAVILGRRDVAKYFDYHGVIEGKSPARDDIFAGPRNGEAVNSPLDGALLRDIEGHELGFTDSGGVFNLDSLQNPAIFQASLESGFIDPGARVDRIKKENGYVMMLQIKPLGDNLLENQLLPEEDQDQNGVPDLEIFAFAGSPALGIFNDTSPSDLYTERAWWLQCYHHTKRMLDWAERTLRRLRLSTQDFLPLDGLRVKPTLAPQMEQYRRPLPTEPDIASILTSTTMNVGTPRDPVTHEVVPTRLLHEVGHHIFFSLTGYGEIEPTGIEEGIADVLTGFADESCKILYEGNKQANRPTPLGFCLGAENKAQDGWRADLGDAFWTLEEHVLPEEPEDFARALLFYFLALNRVSTPEDHIFDLSDNVFELLIVTDKLLFGENGFLNQGKSHEQLITNAFRGKRFIDAAFIRGDSNVDQVVNLSDAVTTLNLLFVGVNTGHICKNAMDADDDGVIQIDDAIRVLTYLFLGGLPPADPFPMCGVDTDNPGTPGNLGCFDSTCAR